MKEIGGYFELELFSGSSYHDKVISLNSGRNAFKYILEVQNVSKIYIPVYICDSIVEPLKELNTAYEFYNIDKRFEIIHDIEVKETEKILYVNYYALKSKYVQKLVDKYETKLIVDNTQAFFELPINNIDTIYSPRKFFGVSDGGYLHTSTLSSEILEQDISKEYSHLIGRIEHGASAYYSQYQDAEKFLVKRPIKSMSALTTRILDSISYESAMENRKRNFKFLYKELQKLNTLDIDISEIDTPFVYPFMSNEIELRDELIKNKIYVARYWNEVLERKSANNYEIDFVKKLIPLPIDQRYTIDDMKIIAKIIKNYGRDKNGI